MTKLPIDNLINQYDDVASICKETKEPIFLTEDGEVSLVVMSIDAFKKHTSLLNLKERLLDIEAEQITSNKDYSLEDLDEALKKIIN